MSHTKESGRKAIFPRNKEQIPLHLGQQVTPRLMATLKTIVTTRRQAILSFVGFQSRFRNAFHRSSDPFENQRAARDRRRRLASCAMATRASPQSEERYT